MSKVVKGRLSENVLFEERPGWKAREEVCLWGGGRLGEEHSRQREEQVQRPSGGCDVPGWPERNDSGEAWGRGQGGNRGQNVQSRVGRCEDLACPQSRTGSAAGSGQGRDRSRFGVARAPSGGEVGNGAARRGEG